MRNGSVRASDDDRERVAGSLRDHAVAGRLTPDELDERSGRAFAARTLGELDTLLTDLPRERRRSLAPPAAAALLLARGAFWVAVGIVMVTVAIVWALAWMGARLARLAAATATRSLDAGRRAAIR